MRKRNLSKEYNYGDVLDEQSSAFLSDLFDRAGAKKLFTNKKILDLGCGFGTGSIILSRFAKLVIGVDIIEYKEWKTFKSKCMKFCKADSNKIPFGDNIFEGAVLKDLLHHIRGSEETLKEVKRVTKKNGSIVILEANRYNPVLYFGVTKLKGHDHFSQKEFRNLINASFSSYKFVYLEAYPPFSSPIKFYRFVLFFEKIINKFHFLNPIFAYNVAIIKNVK